MKQKIIFFLMAMVFSALACAQGTLVVTATDGSVKKYALADRPHVRFEVGTEGDKAIITVGTVKEEISVANIDVTGLPEGSQQQMVLNVDGQKQLVPLSSLGKLSLLSYDKETRHLANAIAADASVSIYNQALLLTGLADSIKAYKDVTYSVGPDSTVFGKLPHLRTHIQTEYYNRAYMAERYYKFTALLVPDAVLNEKYGITDIDGLRALAHELYDPVYPDDRNISDETDRRNALNRFISYHLLPMMGEYYKLTCVDGENSELAKNFDRENGDITDWYETMMPHSLMKFSFPDGSEAGLYVNRRGIMDHADHQGVFVRGSRVAEPSTMTDNTAVNGIYHYIDDMVAYGEAMQKTVAHDRIRVDFTTLSPDFMTSGARGNLEGMESWNNGKLYAFKTEALENFSCEDRAREFYVTARRLNHWNYGGEAVYTEGVSWVDSNYQPLYFDVKLPSLPEGKYEIRMGTMMDYTSNGTVNICIDDELKCDHLDLRPSQFYGPGGSMYTYSIDYDYSNGVRRTRYYRTHLLSFITDAQIDDYVNKYGEDYETYFSNEVDGMRAEGMSDEEINQYADEIREAYEEKVVSDFILLFFDYDNGNAQWQAYRNILSCWERAQNYPDEYVFDGDMPLPPDSEEMKAWFMSVIDKDELLQLGYAGFKTYYYKLLRENGWMKGPAGYIPSGNQGATSAMNTFRSTPRKIIGTFTADGASDHFLRIQPATNDDLLYLLYQQIYLDYLELIPVDAIENEDIY